MLVQVNNNNADNNNEDHLDFHGNHGAIGRFECTSTNVILDLKGYQYQGTIRPGPTAMIVALNREGQLKVESGCLLSRTEMWGTGRIGNRAAQGLCAGWSVYGPCPRVSSSLQ